MFFLAIDRNGLWANIRVIDPANGLWRLMALDSDGKQTPETRRPRRFAAARGGPSDRRGVEGRRASGRGESVVAERYAQRPRLSRRRRGASAVADRRARHEYRHRRRRRSRLEACGDACRAGAARGCSRPTMPSAGRSGCAMSAWRRNFIWRTATSPTASRRSKTTAKRAALRRQLGDSLTKNVGRMFRTAGLQLGYRYEALADLHRRRHAAAARRSGKLHALGASRQPRAACAGCATAARSLDLFGRGFVLLRFGDAPTAALEQAAADARRAVDGRGCRRAGGRRALWAAPGAGAARRPCRLARRCAARRMPAR